MEKEIEESDLPQEQKEGFQKLIKEGSGTLGKIGDALSKYGGKFIGQAGRSFVGLPDNEQ